MSKTERIQILQNQCARILTKPKKLHWLKIKDRMIYTILMLTYKSYYNIAPPYLLCIDYQKKKVM